MKSLLTILLSCIVVVQSSERALQRAVANTSIIQQATQQKSIIERTHKAALECENNRLTAARWLLSFWSNTDNDHLNALSTQEINEFLDKRDIIIQTLQTKLSNNQINFIDDHREKIIHIINNKNNGIDQSSKKQLPTTYYPSPCLYQTAPAPEKPWGSQTQDIASQLDAMENAKKNSTSTLRKLIAEIDSLEKNLISNNDQITQIKQEIHSIKNSAIQKLCINQINVLENDNSAIRSQKAQLQTCITQHKESIENNNITLRKQGEVLRDKYDAALAILQQRTEEFNRLQQEVEKRAADLEVLSDRVKKMQSKIHKIGKNNLEDVLNKQ